ncbi:MAG: hypothetical protein ACD_77C00104G0003 [uncultured bacterium]|nr:MAG: hypothetical protein ACD_77C00104G0003 [uncultured bacterium]HBY02281.1 hypothetical protein [Rikenellaceae bacterium]
MKRILILIIVLFSLTPLLAQKERWQVRSGNKAFDKANYQKAELDYRRALEKDSTSVTAKYNLANTMYKQQNVQGAEKMANDILLGAGGKPSVKDSSATEAPPVTFEMSPENMAKTYHNLGNFTLNQKKYSEAIEAYKNSLRINPSDMETKANLAYAQKMLKDQQDKQNKDQNKDKEKEEDKKKDDQNKDENKDQNKDPKKKPEKPKEQQSPPKITPQAAQQMLQAIQNKENETQEKVKKEKAKLMESRKNEKNW